MYSEHKQLGEELAKEFETLELVNCTDMDVFMKVILLSNEKTAQSIRGELNHMVKKFIDKDPELKQKLIKNSYAEMNYNTLLDIIGPLRTKKIQYHKNEIRKLILNESKNTKFARIMEILDTQLLAPGNICVMLNMTDNQIEMFTGIRDNLYEAFKLLDPNSDIYQDIYLTNEGDPYPEALKIDSIFICFSKFGNQMEYKARIHTDILELEEETIMEICNYYTLTNARLTYHNTLEYYRKQKNHLKYSGSET